MKKLGHRFSALWLLCAVLTLFPLLSPEKPWAASPLPASGSGSRPSEPPAASEDPLGRSTPYGVVIGFIRAMEREDYPRASNYLESKQSDKRKRELAHLLKLVFDRGVQISLDSLSRKPEGNLDDGLPPNLESVGVAKLGEQSLDILLRRVDQKGAPPIWLFSAETLLGISDAREQLDSPLGEKIWPAWFKETRFLSAPLFIWINNLLLIPLMLGLGWLLTRALFRVLRPLFLRRIKGLSESEVARFSTPVFLLIFSLLVRIVAPLAATMASRIFWVVLATVLFLMTLTWFLIRLTNLIRELRVYHLRQAHLLNRIAALELSAWLIKGLWVVIGLFLIVRSFGIDVTTALAGLGVGGIAIAFAAQKTLENLFGTVMIVSDQPIRIGDRCQVGNIDGWVEDIGLRSTRIRTQDRTLVSIPNGQLAGMNITNLQQRDKRLFRHIFRLSFESTADQLRHILAEIQRMMAAHPKVDHATERQWIRFIRFGESSLDLEVFVYVLADKTLVFVEIQEELLLRIMDIIEASGTRVALPSEIMYISKDSRQDAGEREAALEQRKETRS